MRPYPHDGETTPPSLAGIAEGMRYALGAATCSAPTSSTSPRCAGHPGRAVPRAGGGGLRAPRAARPALLGETVGALLATALSGWTARVHHHGRAIVVAAAAYGAVHRAGRTDADDLAGARFLMLSGAADMVSAVFRSTVWNQTIPEAMRGRLAGIEMLSYSVGPLGGQVRAGFIADAWTVRGGVVSGGRVRRGGRSPRGRCATSGPTTRAPTSTPSPSVRSGRRRASRPAEAGNSPRRRVPIAPALPRSGQWVADVPPGRQPSCTPARGSRGGRPRRSAPSTRSLAGLAALVGVALSVGLVLGPRGARRHPGARPRGRLRHPGRHLAGPSLDRAVAGAGTKSPRPGRRSRWTSRLSSQSPSA